MKALQFKKLEHNLYSFLKDYCELKNSRPKIRRKSPQEIVFQTHEFLKELLLFQLETATFRGNQLTIESIHTQGNVFEIHSNELLLHHSTNKELPDLKPSATHLLERRLSVFETTESNIYIVQRIEHSYNFENIHIIYAIFHDDEPSSSKWLYIFDLNFKNRHVIIPFDSSKGKKLNEKKFLKLYNNVELKQIYITESEFAEQLKLGIHEFRRQFKEYAFCSLFQYHSTQRMNRALMMFYFSDKRPDEIADELGYTTDGLRSAFSTHFKTSYTKVTRLK